MKNTKLFLFVVIFFLVGISLYFLFFNLKAEDNTKKQLEKECYALFFIEDKNKALNEELFNCFLNLSSVFKYFDKNLGLFVFSKDTCATNLFSNKNVVLKKEKCIELSKGCKVFVVGNPSSLKDFKEPIILYDKNILHLKELCKDEKKKLYDNFSR